MDPICIHRPGETDIVWNFNSPEALDQWVTTSDKDHNEGYSSCSLTMNNYSKGVFTGDLNTRVPKDGKIKRSGYCNMRSIRARKSFKRDSYLDWTMYNVLVMRVRGDGRSYMLNLATTGYFDVMWNDVYNYVLFTRGGPYWQVAKIPFSKFFLSSKGRIQDKQGPIPLDRVTNVGITAGDKINGSFSLEIDYIGVEYDPNITEEFAYEMYKTDKYIAAN
ncbi:Complex I intermediate-associated protein 30 kDa [Carabus blaptoides fortunei]